MPYHSRLWHFASLPLSAISPSASLDAWLDVRLACAWVTPPFFFVLPSASPGSLRASTLRPHVCNPIVAIRDQVISRDRTVPAGVGLRGASLPGTALPPHPF